MTATVLSIAWVLIYVSPFSVLAPLFVLIAKRNFWTDTLIKLLCSLILVSVLFYSRSSKIGPVNDPVRDSPFWINTAFWYYFTVNIFLFCSSSFIFTEASTSIATVFWGFHNFNNIIRNLLLTLGIYFYQKERHKNLISAV